MLENLSSKAQMMEAPTPTSSQLATKFMKAGTTMTLKVQLLSSIGTTDSQDQSRVHVTLVSFLSEELKSSMTTTVAINAQFNLF